MYRALRCHNGAAVVAVVFRGYVKIIESFFGEGSYDKACAFASTMEDDLENTSREELEAVEEVYENGMDEV